MRSVVRTSIAVAALISAAALASAQAEVPSQEGANRYFNWRGVQRHGTVPQRHGTWQQRQTPAQAGKQAPSQGMQENAQTAPSTAMSDDLQAKIRDTVKNNSEARVNHVDFGLRVGTVVPRSERLAALPEDAVAIVPRFKGYKFLIDEEDQDIVIVDPSYRVAAIIPGTEGPNPTPDPTGGPSPTGEQDQDQMNTPDASPRD
jgi:hypothetical protein